MRFLPKEALCSVPPGSATRLPSFPNQSITSSACMHSRPARREWSSCLVIARPSQNRIHTGQRAFERLLPRPEPRWNRRFFFWGTRNSWSRGSNTICETAHECVYSSLPPNAVVGKSGAAALWPGVEIGPSRVWERGLGRNIEAEKCHLHRSSTNTRKFYGPWANGISGKGFKGHYLGLKFLINGKVHYGWARLNTTSGGPLLTGYAYETIPGKAIIAGQTKGPDKTSFEAPNASPTTPAPEPATLGVLAMGAHGLSESRY